MEQFVFKYCMSVFISYNAPM